MRKKHNFLSSNGFRIRVKEGTFKQIKESPEILEYGLYRVKINISIINFTDYLGFDKTIYAHISILNQQGN